MSNYQTGTVMQVTASGEVIQLRGFEPSTADLAFIPECNVLIVPHMNENQVVDYDVSDTIQQAIQTH